MMTVSKIKAYLHFNIGKKIKIIYYGSRNKREIYEGFILKLYQNVFVVKLLSGDIKCFSYIDVLTKTVKIICEFNK